MTRCPLAVRVRRWIALALLVPAAGRAQERAALSVAQAADAVAAAGDTARALAMLDAAVRRDQRDAAAWHQLGLLQWNQARSARRAAFIKDQKKIRLLSAADSALRLATQLAPDSARFWLSLSRFNVQSGVSTMRFASGGQARAALGAATRVGDRLQIADAADMSGMASWRLYESSANRAISGSLQKVQLSSANNWNRKNGRDYINSIAQKIEPPTGAADHAAALAYFEQAVGADSTNLRYSRHLFMAYAERGRWRDLTTVAERRTRQFPLDYQAQLALGLGRHRLADDQGATVAFDSAFALMDDDEAQRVRSLSRILRPRPDKALAGQIGDARGFAALPAAERQGLEAMFWMMSDPLALTQENEFRLEFLARVTFADFRWTNEEYQLRGADSDRGDIYVRYGPPDLELTLSGSASDDRTRLDGGQTQVWGYDTGLVFFFDNPPGFGMARVAFADRDNVDRIRDAVPVSFANVAVTRLLDTIPVRIARFRAGADSSDAVIAARVPVDSLVRSVAMDRVPVDIDLRIFDRFVQVRGLESDQIAVARDSAAAQAERVWTRRLGPGINVVRVEALQADSRRGARAMTRLEPLGGAGFGMSDVLLGGKPGLRSGIMLPARWRDIEITPNAGRFARGSVVGLLWEMYDLRPKDGASAYRVAITVERTDRSGAALAFRLLDNLGRAIGRAQGSRDRFTIAFDRQVASRPELVEYLSLDMAQAPAGTYRLRVEVTDLTTRQKTARDTEFRMY